MKTRLKVFHPYPHGLYIFFTHFKQYLHIFEIFFKTLNFPSFSKNFHVSTTCKWLTESSLLTMTFHTHQNPQNVQKIQYSNTLLHT